MYFAAAATTGFSPCRASIASIAPEPRVPNRDLQTFRFRIVDCRREDVSSFRRRHGSYSTPSALKPRLGSFSPFSSASTVCKDDRRALAVPADQASKQAISTAEDNAEEVASTGNGTLNGSALTFPDFLPERILTIKDPEGRAMAARMQRVGLDVPSLSAEPILSSFVGPRNDGAALSNTPPFLLLHGFDSSCIEFRKLLPYLEDDGARAWAPCILGWGFGNYHEAGVTSFSVEAKRAHLHAFWKSQLGGRPAIVLGASLGGAAALDFAISHPEAVAKLVLIDSQGFAEGVGQMSSLPKFLARAGVELLRANWLRRYAFRLSYSDFKTRDAEDGMRVGSLHCQQPGWPEAQMDFMLSGGYNIAKHIPQVQHEVLVIWGEEDKVLDKAYGERFVKELPRSNLKVIENCGHVPHVEKPKIVADLIMQFARSTST